MRVQIASLPGAPGTPNEDFACANRATAVVVDGLTARTGTGCVHGTAWFAERLGRGVLRFPGPDPADSLRAAIAHTASLHAGTCDLSDPATPCAAVGIVRVGPDGRLRYLVLGDVTVVLAGTGGIRRVVTDRRVELSARVQRAAADALPHGSDAKAAALVRMKQAEIEERNRPGGYWVAGSDPSAADHAIVGAMALSDLTGVALLSDGAARAVEPFHLTDWGGALDLLDAGGPAALVERVRQAERSDRDGVRWRRNKVSDDATAVYCTDLDDHDDYRDHHNHDDDRNEHECASP